MITLARCHTGSRKYNFKRDKFSNYPSEIGVFHKHSIVLN